MTMAQPPPFRRRRSSGLTLTTEPTGQKDVVKKLSDKLRVGTPANPLLLLGIVAAIAAACCFAIFREVVGTFLLLCGAFLQMKLWLAVVLSLALGHVLLQRDRSRKIRSSPQRHARIALLIGFCLALLSQAQAIAIYLFPSIIWSPTAWLTYKIYKPSDIQPALAGLCLEGERDEIDSDALCLSEQSWNLLSSGALSSRNVQDTDTVRKGVHYGRQESGGLIINVLARDSVDAVEPLRQNVEGLLPFFAKLSVVVFENDSDDGTREAIKKWSLGAHGYKVDLMECEEAKDCKLGYVHRHNRDAYKNVTASGVGKMAFYRNRMLNYILESPSYSSFSHMLVLDLDLQVSLSPLGVLHTLGANPQNAIASSGRAIVAGSFGTRIYPYDTAAFVPLPKTTVSRCLFSLHKRYCGLQPPGHRWRWLCDAVSPWQSALVEIEDTSHDELYRVESAYNGVMLYPLEVTRNATYDSGFNGQRCEHVGFNRAIDGPVFVNRKWNLNLDPRHPCGPFGWKVLPDIWICISSFKSSMVVFAPKVVGYFLVALSSIQILLLRKTQKASRTLPL